MGVTQCPEEAKQANLRKKCTWSSGPSEPPESLISDIIVVPAGVKICEALPEWHAHTWWENGLGGIT